MDNEKLIKSIKELCQKSNISVSQLESDLNFSPSLISRWKDKNPNIDRIIDIADYFHVSLDEVVGRNDFIYSVVQKTEKGILTWKSKTILDISEKYAFPFISNILGKNESEAVYYSEYEDKIIFLYSYYNINKIFKPNELILYIRPSAESNVVKQNYSSKELILLYTKILYRVHDELKDEIKVEEFKDSFISTQENLSNERINDFLNDPGIMKLIETMDTKEFRKVQQVFEDPTFKSALQTLNSLQNYLDSKK